MGKKGSAWWLLLALQQGGEPLDLEVLLLLGRSRIFTHLEEPELGIKLPLGPRHCGEEFGPSPLFLSSSPCADSGCWLHLVLMQFRMTQSSPMQD